MFTLHVYAKSQEKAIEAARKQYPRCFIGQTYLDDVWKNPRRWCVDVYAEKNPCAAKEEAADAELTAMAI